MLIGLILFLLGIAILGFIFWIIMLVDSIKRKYKNEDNKIVWILVIIFLGIIGALIYFFTIKKGDKKSGKKAEQKGFVWYSLRISFLLMILFFIISLSFPLFLTSLINFLFLILLIFAIIVSVVHLSIHKKRALAITALIISTLLLLFYIIGLVSQTQAG